METRIGSGGKASLAFSLGLKALFVLAFLTGGSSQVIGSDDLAVQLVALPLLAWSLWRLVGIRDGTPVATTWLLMGAVMLVPVVQLLAIPESLWTLPEARRVLLADLAVAGVVPEHRWTLAPDATQRAVWFLLLPITVFAGTVTLPQRAHAGLLYLVMLVVMASLMLAFLQLGVPAESMLNPFPEWAHHFNGVFANPNHQGIAMVVAIVIAVAALLEAPARRADGRAQAWLPWLLGFAATFALLALPLTGSRASVLIGVFAIALVPVAMGVFARHRLRASRLTRVWVAACAVLVGIGIWGGIGWMQVDSVDELRGPMRQVAWELGFAHAPLGTGVGAFVQAFAQGAPDELLRQTYVNHAHNEYAQWWMEAGFLGAAVFVMVLVILGRTSVLALAARSRDRFPAVAACIGLGALLLHSWVDYPLRTTSLAVVAAALVGVLVSRAAAMAHPMPVGEGAAPRHTV